MMIAIKLLSIFFCIMVTQLNKKNKVFGDENTRLLNKNSENLESNNTLKMLTTETKHKAVTLKRRVLILNEDDALRSKKSGKKGSKEITSLLYKEYDDNGKVLNSYTMTKLEDVIQFFKVFLDTEICYSKCENE